MARDTILGKNIRRMIEANGMTQRSFADEIEVSEVSMSRYIRGERTPSASMLRKIAEGLGTTTDALLSNDERESPYEKLRMNVKRYTFLKITQDLLSEIKGFENKVKFLKYAKSEINNMLKVLEASK